LRPGAAAAVARHDAARSCVFRLPAVGRDDAVGGAGGCAHRHALDDLGLVRAGGRRPAAAFAADPDDRVLRHGVGRPLNILYAGGLPRKKARPSGTQMADEDAIEVDLTGPDLLANPLLNKGTAFSERERDTFGLHGFLPPHIGTLDVQISRRMEALRALESDG